MVDMMQEQNITTMAAIRSTLSPFVRQELRRISRQSSGKAPLEGGPGLMTENAP
jgi:hypothetical protein